MKILISNDDGIFSNGLAVLEEVMGQFGETLTVAPQWDQSGVSHALTLNRPLRIEKINPKRYALDGTPTDCIHFAIQELYKESKPDLIVSGINLGANLGEDVWYSGTVGAAIEGSLLGIKSIALSVVSLKSSDFQFQPMIGFIEDHLMKVIEQSGPRTDILYNINVPSIDENRIDNIEFTRLGSRRYKSTLVRNLDPRGKVYFWIGGEKIDFDSIEGTDSNALRQGHISITPIQLNITDTRQVETMKSWKL